MPVIEKLDCACNVWDWLQLIYESGQDEGCFSWSAISTSEWMRIGAFLGSTLVDCFSQEIMNRVVDAITGMIAGGTTAGGAGAGSPGGPGGAAGGGGIGAVIGLAIREFFSSKGREIADLLVDLMLYLAQNSLTHGSPFPLDGCRSCLRIPSYFGYSDMSGRCDEWNEELVPEALRVPEWHGTATGARPAPD